MVVIEFKLVRTRVEKVVPLSWRLTSTALPSSDSRLENLQSLSTLHLPHLLSGTMPAGICPCSVWTEDLLSLPRAMYTRKIYFLPPDKKSCKRQINTANPSD